MKMRRIRRFDLKDMRSKNGAIMKRFIIIIILIIAGCGKNKEQDSILLKESKERKLSQNDKKFPHPFGIQRPLSDSKEWTLLNIQKTDTVDTENGRYFIERKIIEDDIYDRDASITIYKNNEPIYHLDGYLFSYQIVQLFNNNSKQLIIVNHSGGNSGIGDDSYLYDLGTEKSIKIPNFNFKELSDIDLDDIFEIVTIEKFYLDDRANVLQPWYKIVYKFNKSEMRYERANQEFSKYLLDINKTELIELLTKREFSLSNKSVSKPDTDIIEIILSYIYSGNKNEILYCLNDYPFIQEFYTENMKDRIIESAYYKALYNGNE